MSILGLIELTLRQQWISCFVRSKADKSSEFWAFFRYFSEHAPGLTKNNPGEDKIDVYQR
jgi:hypothetical protein